ncbi:MAG TPA: hypothetical protein VNZ85_05150 [Caulobacter sp.]|nr:hypothetical protein [Caulobacter sp.]
MYGAAAKARDLSEGHVLRNLTMLSALIFALLALAGDRSAALGDPLRRVKAPAVAEPSAQAYAWRPVAIGGGGFITGYSADANGVTRVVRADVYGAYLWRPDVDRWVQLVTTASMPQADRQPMTLNEGVYEVVVAPSDPDRIYMALHGAVYRSSDRGRSFVKTGLPPVTFDANSPFRHYGPFIAVSPHDPDLLLFGTPNDGLWRSTNGGGDWTRVKTAPGGAGLGGRAQAPRPGVVVWFSPDGAQVWAASAGEGVSRSVDGGRTFMALAAVSDPQPRALRQGAFGPDGVFYGVDHDQRKVWKYSGTRWEDLTGAPGLDPAPFASVAVDPQGSAIYVFDEGGHAVRSDDGGKRWSHVFSQARVGEGEPPWLHVSNQSYFATGKVVFDPVVRGRLWNAAGTGVYVADLAAPEASITWTSQVRGIEELVANDVSAAPGQLPLFAAWDFGIHRRDDLERFSTGYGPKERVLIAAQQVDWTPAQPGFFVTNASDTRTDCCSEDGDAVLAGYSEDGGRTWSKFATLPQPPGTSASDPWRMAFGAIAVAANDPRNIVWAPTRNRSPFYTKDMGRSWRRVVLPGERLPDTGSHSAYNFHRKTLAADRVAPDTFYLVHSGGDRNPTLVGLWVTRDGGDHWSRIYRGEIAPGSRYSAKLRAVPGQAGHLFFTSGVSNPGDTALRRSIDGGRTWSVLRRVEAVHDVAFGKAAPGAPYPAIYVAGRVDRQYGIWRSIDDAAHWSRVGQFPVGALDEVVAMDADKDVFGRVYLGFKGSGWRYGQPSACKAAPYTLDDDHECFSISPVGVGREANAVKTLNVVSSSGVAHDIR